ncbi:MAG: hypothetical protein LBF34_00365 [Puniceicoccales bacterium]|jgi:hypothetical protein|nr:hypothetical protein [Puniceicoccales bacterium]
MVILDSNTIRVRVDVLSFDAPIDDVRKQLVQFWRCNDLQFRVGIFHGNEVIDVGNFAALHLSVRSLDDGNPPSGSTASLMLGSATTFDTTVTAETWATGAKQHAEITFSAADNALEAGEYWISFWATTETGHTVTLGSGVCKVLENGGISLTPPEPKENYYTAEECDEKFALIGSEDVDLSNYYTKTETYSQTEVGEVLEDYYTKTETYSTLENYYTTEECDDKIEEELGSTLENYYTVEECDAKIEEELGSALENYYTAEECDGKFTPIDGGGGSGSGDSGLVPENKGELVIGNGSGAALLTAGQNRQLLVANPNATLGAEWSNYPWQLLQEITITNPVASVSFENAFSAGSFWHYKLSYNFITTSNDGERLLMVFGYDNDGTTIWETSTGEYSYNTSDFAGAVAKYATYQFVDGFFGFGNDSATYRNNGGWMHGEMDLWNDGNVTHKVQARTCTNGYRISNDSFIAIGGIYNFIYKNVGAKVIRSLKIYVTNGTLTSGRFTLYGIH